MTEGVQKRLGFSAIGGRKAKAQKIAAVLEAAGHPLQAGTRVLDLGCGSGEIAAHLARFARVSCADARDQRTAGRELPFTTVDRTLAYDGGHFDVVISNHVIEHVPDALTHLREIRRVLRPGGVCYLATPNRWWPWEFHARLPVLHYLPWRQFARVGRALGRLHEPVRLVSPNELERLSRGLFALDNWHPRVAADPRRFGLNPSPALASALRLLPYAVLDATADIQPTLIVVLRPR